MPYDLSNFCASSALSTFPTAVSGRPGTWTTSSTGLVPVSAPEAERRWRLVADLEHEIGWSTELLTVMRTCAERLPELISGDVGIRELLFPGAATEVADAAYRDNLAIRHLNRAVVAALREIAASHTGEERLRVLEVGGGVGGRHRLRLTGGALDVAYSLLMDWSRQSDGLAEIFNGYSFWPHIQTWYHHGAPAPVHID